MGLSDSIEKFTEVKSEFDPITKPLDDNDHNNFSKDAVIINETTGNTIHQINSFR